MRATKTFLAPSRGWPRIFPGPAGQRRQSGPLAPLRSREAGTVGPRWLLVARRHGWPLRWRRDGRAVRSAPGASGPPPVGNGGSLREPVAVWPARGLLIGPWRERSELRRARLPPPGLPAVRRRRRPRRPGSASGRHREGWCGALSRRWRPRPAGAGYSRRTDWGSDPPSRLATPDAADPSCHQRPYCRDRQSAPRSGRRLLRRTTNRSQAPDAGRFRRRSTYRRSRDAAGTARRRRTRRKPVHLSSCRRTFGGRSSLRSFGGHRRSHASSGDSCQGRIRMMTGATTASRCARRVYEAVPRPSGRARRRRGRRLERAADRPGSRCR
jgi:hypothetical protein